MTAIYAVATAIVGLTIGIYKLLIWRLNNFPLSAWKVAVWVLLLFFFYRRLAQAGLPGVLTYFKSLIMAVYTETIGNEVYIYMNGMLTMKRWLKEQRSVVFTPFPYEKHTVISITDNGIIDRTKQR